MRLSDFDYELPEGLIAQYPVRDREKCRLMVLDRKHGAVRDGSFEDILGYFRSGDCLVLNDTKVMTARLFGKRATGGRVEIFLLRMPDTDSPVEALVRPSGRLREGEKIALESGDTAEMLGHGEIGRFVKFSRRAVEIMKESGHVPLPPYIGRPDEPSDKSDYQTVYAGREGATASPTAGLHFTRELIDRIASRGVRIAYITLHTSYGTFAPVKTDEVESHRMHEEYFELPAETAAAVRETKGRGGSVFAVGTTTTRVLEHCADKLTAYDLQPATCAGHTGLFIYPGYTFRVVDRLITNFHLPKSTLLMLVSAFAGREFVLDAYRQAIAAGYRFFSYGDAMLVA